MVLRRIRATTGALMAAGLMATGILAATAPPASAEEPTPARMLALSCAACHGPDGASPGSIPALKGLEPAVIATAMRAFRDGSRPATVMGRIASGYSDAEIDLLSRQFPAGEMKQ